MSIWYNQIYDFFEGKYIVSYKVYYGVFVKRRAIVKLMPKLYIKIRYNIIVYRNRISGPMCSDLWRLRKHVHYG